MTLAFRVLLLPCYAIALNSYRETLRNKVVASLVVFSVILMAIGTLMGAMSLHHEIRVATNVGLFMTTLLGVIMGIYSSVTLLHTEFERRTIYTLLSKPVHRWQFLVGKLLGVAFLCFVVVLTLGTISGLLTVFLGGEITSVYLIAYFMVFLQSVIVAALSIFFATFSGSLLAGVCAFGVFVAGSMMSQIEIAINFFKQASPAVVPLIQLLTYILPNLEALSLTDELTYHTTVSMAYALTSVWYCVCYVSLTMLFSMLMFERRNLQ